jgi:hypothetical protein
MTLSDGTSDMVSRVQLNMTNYATLRHKCNSTAASKDIEGGAAADLHGRLVSGCILTQSGL